MTACTTQTPPSTLLVLSPHSPRLLTARPTRSSDNPGVNVTNEPPANRSTVSYSLKSKEHEPNGPSSVTCTGSAGSDGDGGGAGAVVFESE